LKAHTKIYFDYFGYGEDDFIPCENCGSRAVDIHHIDNKGMGGSKTKDFIENLIALCRKCHNAAHDGYFTKSDLKYMHKIKMNSHERTLRKC